MTLTVHMIGNAHLDPVWLWPWQEGVDEAIATFRSAADRCDEYPEFIFSRGEAWQYEQLEKLDPVLFERIKKLVYTGQWHITGGQYLQPDLNGPIGESHQRQFTRGLAYFEETFGVRPRTALNVDSFGHPATFPDLIAPLGMEGYLIQRPKEFQMKLPQAFVWKGPKGSELVTFRMSKPYTSMTLEELEGALTAAIDNAVPGVSDTMCLYGIGNHGGGPSKQQIEWIIENKTAFENVVLKFSTPDAYLDAINPQREYLPIIEGDLQHCFPGCYSVMHDIHQSQRHGELRLQQTEAIIKTFSPQDLEPQTNLDVVERAWDDLLFTAFHDILAGTSVKRSWSSIRAMFGRAQISAEEVIHMTTRRWARQNLGPQNAHRHILLNANESDWDGWLEIEPWLEDYSNWDDRWISDNEGTPIDFQLVQPEANIRSRALIPARVEAHAHKVLLIQPGPLPKQEIATDLQTSPTSISNDLVSLDFGQGGLSALTYKGEPIFSQSGLKMFLRTDMADCWGMFTDTHNDPIDEVWAVSDWVIEETGPLRNRARLEGRLGNSRVLLLVSLYRGCADVHFEVQVNYDERGKLLQISLPWQDNSTQIIDGLPGGQLERQTSIVEWPFQAWTKRKTDACDIALLTHDIYSLSHRQDKTILTLLRAPVMASAGNTPLVYTGRDDYTDQGVHEFKFVLRLGENLEPSKLDKAADDLVKTPIHFDYYEGMDRPLPLAANHTEPNSMVNQEMPDSINSVNRQ